MKFANLKISFSNLSHVLVLFIALGLGSIGFSHMFFKLELPPIFIWGMGLAAYFFTLSDVFNNGKGRGILHVTLLYLGALTTVIAIFFPIHGVEEIDYLKNSFVEGITIIAIAIIFLTFAFKAMNEEIAKISELEGYKRKVEDEKQDE